MFLHFAKRPTGERGAYIYPQAFLIAESIFCHMKACKKKKKNYAEVFSLADLLLPPSDF